MGASDRGDGGVVDELENWSGSLEGPRSDVGFDLEAFMQERAPQAPAAGKAGDKTLETMASSRGSTVDASSVPAVGAERNPGAASSYDTGQGNGEDLPAVLSGRPAHELSSWRQLPPTILGRTRGQSHRLVD